ncbi:uncharacterized protein A4U43_C04F10410 [Asparagus officinalis]|uniref:EF-hand domain-containing protein n=1 Tax=Asparagus officinalis TaxID=4686 RepID=A0A5P1EZT7_ASPOF|nr:uncharacterized protein LOC109837027 [Asparagus officinalis]ONK71605.1 uncharacterized protein A4U43_C04F10410 [Asparagus officinalis]
MGQVAGHLWDRAQGKWQVQRICDKIFNQWPEKDKGNLAVKDLHIVTLMVYNSMNKQFLSPYKEPPSMEAVQSKVKALSAKGTTAISRNEFYEIIMEWIHKDLRIVLANRVILALLAGPLLAVQTKKVGRQVPRIRDTVDKVPTPLIASVYAAGIVLLQDVRVD